MKARQEGKARRQCKKARQEGKAWRQGKKARHEGKAWSDNVMIGPGEIRDDLSIEKHKKTLDIIFVSSLDENVTDWTSKS